MHGSRAWLGRAETAMFEICRIEQQIQWHINAIGIAEIMIPVCIGKTLRIHKSADTILLRGILG